MILLVITISCLSLLFAIYLARHVCQRDTGTEKMQEISNAIKEGAEAFLSRQNRTIIAFSAVLAAVIFVLYAYVRSPSPADPVPPLQMAFWTTLSFVLGAACSVIAGYIGMWVSIRTNIRTASAARSSLNDALRIALRGGVRPLRRRDVALRRRRPLLARQPHDHRSGPRDPAPHRRLRLRRLVRRA